MGGPTSPQFARFQQLAYTAFIELRKNANLILNLVALMVDAGIQDIQLEPDKAVWKVSNKPMRGTAQRTQYREVTADTRQVQEKFMLDVSEEVAIKQFEVLLNDTSYLTVVFDRIHNWSVPLAVSGRATSLSGLNVDVAGRNICEISLLFAPLQPYCRLISTAVWADHAVNIRIRRAWLSRFYQPCSHAMICDIDQFPMQGIAKVPFHYRPYR